MLEEKEKVEPGMHEPSAMLDQARSLIDSLSGEDVTARLLGGVAIALRCSAALPPSPLARQYSDLDMVVSRRGGRDLPAVLAGLEFTGAERFNAMNGYSRQLYVSADGIELDVFVEEFKMCHELDLKSRLEVDAVTLPLADLVLTKLQVARLTDKDVQDFAAVVLSHPLSEDESGIDVRRINEVTGRDWGWWKTVTDNLGKVVANADQLGLDAAAASRVVAVTTELRNRIDAAPKSLRWKARAKVGDRVPWREEPDEKR